MSPEQIRSVAVSFQASRILLTSFELGIFSIIGGRKLTAEQIAGALRTDVRATDRLLNALTALGFCVKENSGFRNSPGSAKYLVKGKPEYMAGLMHTAHLWNTWSTLTGAVRRGTRTAAAGGPQDDWLGAFIGAMHDRARKQAPVIASMIDLKGVTRLLDVGGGPGSFSMAFVRSKPGIHATIFDLPDVIPLSRRYVRESHLNRKFDFFPGDYLKNRLPGGYDLVFLSAIIHSNSDQQNRRLIKKCSASLNPGGRVIVIDWLMDESRTQPAQGAFFALNMLVGTAAGDTYRESDVADWMRSAGLTEIERRNTPFGTSILSGRKPAFRVRA